jgi:hypothetical protein
MFKRADFMQYMRDKNDEIDAKIRADEEKALLKKKR